MFQKSTHLNISPQEILQELEERDLVFTWCEPIKYHVYNAGTMKIIITTTNNNSVMTASSTSAETIPNQLGRFQRMTFITKVLFQCYFCCSIIPAMIKGTSLFLSIFTLVRTNCSSSPDSLVFLNPLQWETFLALR